MVKKKITSGSKKTSKKRYSKKRRASSSKTKVKEIVRVKTFIVEKPVYVQTPTRFQRIKEKIPLYSGGDSRYSKQKEFEDDYANKGIEENFDGPLDTPLDDSVNEPLDENFDESINESMDEPVGEEVGKKGHVRSRGLFKNIWWKKGILKGIFVWLLIVIFVYVLDFFGMAEVVDAKRWAFFFILLVIFGMGYQKYLSGKIDF